MLVRVASNGSIAYSGYFGGSGNDRGVAVALDSAGEVYFTGGTTSANFPAANAYRNYNAGLQDAFIAKLSADGATLRYSTYLGGSDGTSGQGETGNWIAVDSGGAAIVVGTTASNNFPVTGSAFQPVFGGGATGRVRGENQRGRELAVVLDILWRKQRRGRPSRAHRPRTERSTSAATPHLPFCPASTPFSRKAGTLMASL